ncbi:hypothetical protein Tco_0878734 [Tanacetum coccineum]|uniref:Uncharacterized protein n=1 Tax=Tanacetum coccineum TaxID=301880 RepID=A0ABQ5C250_9ASTR
MANFHILESLAIDVGSHHLHDRMRVFFQSEVAYEEEFVEDLRDQCFKVRVDMERRSLMIIELEGLGVALDCIDRLRAMQKSDTKKLVSLRRMLLEARVEAHERQLVCDSMDDND